MYKLFFVFLWALLASLVLFACDPVAVFAASGDVVGGIGTALWDEMRTPLYAGLGALATGLVIFVLERGLVLFERWTGFRIRLTETHREKIGETVRRIIVRTEESAPSGERERVGIEGVTKALKVSPDEAKNLIDEEIPNLAHLGIGKIGKKVLKGKFQASPSR